MFPDANGTLDNPFFGTPTLTFSTANSGTDALVVSGRAGILTSIDIRQSSTNGTVTIGVEIDGVTLQGTMTIQANATGTAVNQSMTFNFPFTSGFRIFCTAGTSGSVRTSYLLY